VSSISVLAAQYNVGRFVATATLLGTYVADKVISGAVPAPYARLSPSLSLMYQPVASFPLRLRASYKDAYRVPTFADLYYLRLGNVELKPEKASQFNFGLVWNESFGRVVNYASVSVDGFYNKVKDKIVALPTMYVWRMMNFGKADIAGVDVTAQVDVALSRKISLLFDAGYSFQHAVDVTDASAKNYRHQMPYTPRHSGKFTLSLMNPYVNVSYIFTAVGDRYMLPQNTLRNRIDGYTEHSFSLNRDFVFDTCSLRLQGELLNIGNKQYEVIRYYPMPRFSWRLSACFSF
jgi:outer membrane cobalamin receptor